MNPLKVLLLLILLFLGQFGFGQNYHAAGKAKNTNRNYQDLGNVLPDSIPIIFAPGIISRKDYNNHTLTISPDGKEIYFTRDPLNIWSLKVIDGKWSSPKKTEPNGREPIFSPDGNKLFFNDGDIWYIEKIDDMWGTPKKLDSTINTDKHEYYGSVTRDGTLYFSRIIERGNPKIFYSRLKNGSFSKAMEMDSVINNGGAFHPYISPEEDFIIFNSNKPGGFGEADLYVSYKDEKDHWTKPVNLGSKINSELRDICPVLSPDGKYLFFTRNWQENGKQYGDIYWVSTKVIDDIKKEVFNPKVTK
jgi:Tol biopolymer transport system component